MLNVSILSHSVDILIVKIIFSFLTRLSTFQLISYVRVEWMWNCKDIDSVEKREK